MAPDFADSCAVPAGGLLGREPDDFAVAPGRPARRAGQQRRLAITFAALAAKLAPQALPSAACTFDFPRRTIAAAMPASSLQPEHAAAGRGRRATGEVRVLDLEQHVAAGPVLDRYLGQIEGGGVQGLGFTLTEDMILQGGRYLAENLDGYMIPTIADAPNQPCLRAGRPRPR